MSRYDVHPLIDRSARTEDAEMGEAAPRTRNHHETPPGIPRWVKIAALLVGLLILLFVILQLTGIGGAHGPGRHLSEAASPDFWTPVTTHAPAAATALG